MVKIVPTILARSQKDFLDRLVVLKKLRLATAQLDIVDGKFTKPVTWLKPQAVKNIAGFKWEVHLMVKNPMVYVQQWLAVKQVLKFIIHVETLNQAKFLALQELLQKNKREFCLAINPQTNLIKIIPYLKQQTKPLILVMSVAPGRGGQKFDPKQLARIMQLRQLFPRAIIEVDGGVKLEITSKIVKAGVDILAIGNYLDNQSRLSSLQLAK
ncbi:MAG: hypothetical protein WCW02_02225 [Candidatus Buchananbacteria bacterium]